MITLDASDLILTACLVIERQIDCDALVGEDGSTVTNVCTEDVRTHNQHDARRRAALVCKVKPMQRVECLIDRQESFLQRCADRGIKTLTFRAIQPFNWVQQVFT